MKPDLFQADQAVSGRAALLQQPRQQRLLRHLQHWHPLLRGHGDCTELVLLHHPQVGHHQRRCAKHLHGTPQNEALQPGACLPSVPFGMAHLARPGQPRQMGALSTKEAATMMSWRLRPSPDPAKGLLSPVPTRSSPAQNSTQMHAFALRHNVRRGGLLLVRLVHVAGSDPCFGLCARARHTSSAYS